MEATTQPRSLPLMQRVLLAERIEKARAEKISWDKISEQEEIPARTLQYLFRSYQETQDIHGDGIKAVDQTLRIFSEAISELSEAAQDADSTSARVGAIRTMLDAAKGRLELLAAMGRLPRQLGTVQEGRDVGMLVAEMARVIERHNLGDEVVRELLAVVEEASHMVEGEVVELGP